MKSKILAFVFAGLYVFMTSGMVLQLHFCQGEFVDLHLSSSSCEDHCDKDCCAHDDTCCDYLSVHVDPCDDHTSFKQVKEVVSTTDAVQPFYINVYHQVEKTIGEVIGVSPGIPPPIIDLYCSHLTYG